MKNDEIDKYLERIYVRDLIIHRSLKVFRLLGLVLILYFGVVSVTNWNSDSKVFTRNFSGLILSGLTASLMHEGVRLTKENIIRPEDLDPHQELPRS